MFYKLHNGWKGSKRSLKFVLGQHPTLGNQEEAQEQPEQPEEEAAATWPPKLVKH